MVFYSLTKILLNKKYQQLFRSLFCLYENGDMGLPGLISWLVFDVLARSQNINLLEAFPTDPKIKNIEPWAPLLDFVGVGMVPGFPWFPRVCRRKSGP